MLQSPGYCETLKRAKKGDFVYVYKLYKSINGLKKAFQVCNETISKLLKSTGSQTMHKRIMSLL
mgnify:CR=1 FL=1